MKLILRDDNKLTDIPVIYIMPNKSQPRKIFNKDELDALSQSILKNGILQPLTVRKHSPVEYELIAGERRLRAAIMAGFAKVPCIVMKCTDNQSAIFALIENLQRTDLNMFEEAFGIKKLITECNMTQEQIAKQIGKNQSTVANKLRLLRLTPEEQKIILNNKLTERHARVVLKLGEEKRLAALKKIAEDSLNVAKSEKLVNEMLGDCPVKKKKSINQKFIIKDVRIFINTFMKAYDTMKSSGINAVSNKVESDEYIEYSVRIPKRSVYSS